jgi:hypothetical protein
MPLRHGHGHEPLDDGWNVGGHGSLLDGFGRNERSGVGGRDRTNVANSVVKPGHPAPYSPAQDHNQYGLPQQYGTPARGPSPVRGPSPHSYSNDSRSPHQQQRGPANNNGYSADMFGDNTYQQPEQRVPYQQQHHQQQHQQQQQHQPPASSRSNHGLPMLQQHMSPPPPPMPQQVNNPRNNQFQASPRYEQHPLEYDGYNGTGGSGAGAGHLGTVAPQSARVDPAMEEYYNRTRPILDQHDRNAIEDFFTDEDDFTREFNAEAARRRGLNPQQQQQQPAANLPQISAPRNVQPARQPPMQQLQQPQYSPARQQYSAMPQSAEEDGYAPVPRHEAVFPMCHRCKEELSFAEPTEPKKGANKKAGGRGTFGRAAKNVGPARRGRR